ncbi:protein HEG homolog 1 [Drosophila navojoa]|nr:protein HEG homolog 1 [Drosophila navojoa]
MMLHHSTVVLLLLLLLAAVATGTQNQSQSQSKSPTRLHHNGHRVHRQRHPHNAVKSEVELLPGVSMPPMAGRGTDNTRLRRLHHAHHPYNKVLTRRLHQRPTEWDYNTYNIYTNTFGPPPPPVPVSPYAGKGEDNTGDVEFIGVTGRGRGSEYVPPITTAAPPPNLNRRAATPGLGMGTVPPLVPARRGYSYSTTAPSTSSSTSNASSTTSGSTTEEPYETNTISRNYPTDAKEMERRHICVQQRTITMPVKTTEVYTRPTWKHISTPCQPPTHPGQMCTRVQLVHEQAYRDVIKHKPAQQLSYECCAGWSRETPRADACKKPVCTTRCQNGGNCTAPQTCSCPAGFTGRYCEQDVNECQTEKPCDQQCVNTQGSYYCRCRQGFVLQADQQSCRKSSSHADDAFEARDLENDIDDTDAEVVSRLQKIERSLANERIHTNELQKSLQATYSVVDTLKSRLSTLEKQAMDVNRMQTNLYKTESRTNKLESMINLLFKCRNAPNANCP